MTTPGDRHGNLVPFSPYVRETLDAWQNQIGRDLAFAMAMGRAEVCMSSVFGGGECATPQAAACLSVELGDATIARTLGNQRIYGPEVIGDTDYGYATRQWSA